MNPLTATTRTDENTGDKLTTYTCGHHHLQIITTPTGEHEVYNITSDYGDHDLRLSHDRPIFQQASNPSSISVHLPGKRYNLDTLTAEVNEAHAVIAMFIAIAATYNITLTPSAR